MVHRVVVDAAALKGSPCADSEMMSTRSCPSCCPRCSSQSPPCTGREPSPSPYALANFLPAGTIRVFSPPSNVCGHEHAMDGWHPFSASTGVEGDSGLTFLVVHKFV